MSAVDSTQKHTSFRHAWLYAKGHYPKLSDPLVAMKIVLAHDSGMSPDIYDGNSTASMLGDFVLDHTLPNKTRMYDFIYGIFRGLIDQESIHTEQPLDTSEGRYSFLIERCLSQMANTAKDNPGVPSLSLGEIDPQLHKQLLELQETEYELASS